jgi:hypothetical protein
MKNQKLILTIVCIAIFSSVFAQTAWDTQGNTLNAGDWIGSQNGFPLQLRTDLAQPIIFQTNGATERMRLTQTGFLGLGTAAPVSLFHLNSATATAINSRFTNSATGVTATDGFSLGITTTGVGEIRQNENQPINFFTNNIERMRLTQTGFLGLGTAAPVSLLHLNSATATAIHGRFTNSSTGATGTDGTRFGIETSGEFRLIQFENQNTDIWTPNLALTTRIQRIRLQPNGQVFVGNGAMAENVIDGGPIANFGQTSLLNVRGPINSCGQLSSLAEEPTILYGYTNPNDAIAPTGDGFRMHMNLRFRPNNNFDALVFEKTDVNEVVPDGYIAFTNTGLSGEEVISSYIDGRGRMYVGDSIIAPLTNRFTIDSRPGDATPSGLRFVDLTSSEIPVSNPGLGVLSVNPQGNVIYVNAPTGSGLGNNCGVTANPLTGNYQIPMNDFNLYFENSANQAVNQNLVAIGYDCGSALEAKLNVFSTKEVWSGSFYVNGANPATASQQLFQGGVKSIIDSTNSENATAVYGYVAPNLQAEMLSQVGVKGEVDAYQAKEAIGVFGVATIQDPTGGAIGGRFLSSGSGFGRAVQAQNITSETFSGPGTGFGFGGDFSCYNPLGTSVGSNTGVVGSADGKAQRNFGVLGRATGDGNFNCGVYGEASGGASNYAAYFQGDVYVNGGATSGSGYLIASDQQFKNGVNNFSNGLEILEEIAPKTYYLDTNNNFGINFPSTLQYGMIAQDVEQVLPSLVSEVTKPASYDSLGNVLTQEITYKSLNYNAFIPILISAVKEQNEKIDIQDEKIDSLSTVVDDLSNRLTQLENCLSGILPFLCQMSNSSIQQTPEMVQEQIRTAINVDLSDKNTIVLNQNVPNPFVESTVITYSIPATVVKAQIHFNDGQGKLINSVEITNRGAGQLNVFGEDLSSGTYTYSLVADGQVVSAKKMVKE